jgi:hypothetical protein
MSAGGQNSSSLVGIQGMRLRDSSDVVAQTRVREIYQMFSPTMPNAFKMRTKTSTTNYLQFLQGYKEVSSSVEKTTAANATCLSCAGLPYNAPRIPGAFEATILTFNNPYP